MAFRSDTNGTAPFGSATGDTFAAPAGLADNDILLLVYYVEDDVTPTPPTGFTQLTDIDHSGAALDVWVWWKRAASESGSYTVSHASAWREGWLGCFSGRITSGDPYEADFSTGEGNDSSPSITGITTDADDTDIIAVVGTYNSSSSTVPSGTTPTYTEQQDSGNNMHVYTGTLAAAGATGNKSVTITSSPWVIAHIALKPAGGGGGGPTVKMLPSMGAGT